MRTAAAPPATVVHSGPGTYAAVPRSGMPAWAVAMLVLGGAILAAMLVLMALLSRQRRRLGLYPRPDGGRSAPSPNNGPSSGNGALGADNDLVR